MKKEIEVKENCVKEIYLNILKAIIVMLYFFILNLSYLNLSKDHLLLGIKIFTMIFLFISIYIFEKAYKKDDEKLALQGIEILILATCTLTIEHITNKFKFNFRKYASVESYVFAIYFILKCIVLYTKGRKEVVREFSDIREIVKKDEPTKKEATKRAKVEESTNFKIKEKKENEKIETKRKTSIDSANKQKIKKKKRGNRK